MSEQALIQDNSIQPSEQPKTEETSQKENAFFWNLYARCYDSVYHLMPYRKLLWDAYQALDLKPGMKVLDAGCGTGNFELFISEKNPPPIEVKAVDFSPVMLSKAQNKCKHLDYINFKQADLNQELEYPDDSFDRILNINTLYALRDPYFTLDEFARVLKPEGSMVVTSSKPDFRFSPIVRDHFKRVGNIWGIYRKAGVLLKTFTIFPTTGLGSGLLNTLVINRREQRGEYHSLSEEELAAIFSQNGQNKLRHFTIDSAFADQNLFAIATREIFEAM